MIFFFKFNLIFLAGGLEASYHVKSSNKFKVSRNLADVPLLAGAIDGMGLVSKNQLFPFLSFFFVWIVLIIIFLICFKCSNSFMYLNILMVQQE